MADKAVSKKVQVKGSKGKIKVKLSDALETEVDASAYMAELRNEVSALRGELARTREQAQEEASGGDLLLYMQGLGRENVAEMTSSGVTSAGSPFAVSING